MFCIWSHILSWLIMELNYFFFYFFFFPVNFFFVQSGVHNISVNLLNNVGKIFSEVAESKKMAMVFLCCGTFFYLIITNLMGLIPFVFTSSAHPMMTLGMGLVMWFSFFLMGWIKNFKNSAAHLVPEGSPIYLSPLMVLIELISHLMRPFTLSIRLAANMMAGHLIVSLLASISMMNLFGFCSSIFLQSVLLILEIGVSIIQGFVFSILVMLYALEYY